MIVSPGDFIRKLSASSAVTKSPEMNSPLPSMKKHRSASPSQAIPMSAFCRLTSSVISRRAPARGDIATVVLEERIGLVIGKRAIDIEAESGDQTRQTFKKRRRHEAGHS